MIQPPKGKRIPTGVHGVGPKHHPLEQRRDIGEIRPGGELAFHQGEAEQRHDLMADPVYRGLILTGRHDRLLTVVRDVRRDAS